MKTLIVAGVITGLFVWVAVWAGAKLDDEDFEGTLPWWHDDSSN